VKRSILGVLLVLTFVAVGIAAAPPLTFTFKDVHANKTALETDTYAVNDFGTIAGDFVDSTGVQHGMIHGIPTTSFDYSKCSAAIAAFGINKSCTVAGWCSSATGAPIGFTRTKDGTFTDVNFPGGTGTEATGINDNGDVVGLYFDANGAQHGFLLKGGSYTSIDVPSESSTAAWGINNTGKITVYAVNSNGGFDSFLYDGTTFTNINDPNAGPSGTVVHTPNNKGDITGTYYDSSGNTHGWLLHGGTYYDVNDTPTLTRADGLNDKLEIVGRYTPATGGNVGFKATTTKATTAAK
jgi:probable HAF family extracellular repeat protein